MEELLMLAIPAVILLMTAKKTPAGTVEEPEEAGPEPYTPPTMLEPAVTPDVVPGNTSSQQEQAVNIDIIPVNTAPAVDVNSTAYIYWANELKTMVYRTLQTFGAAQEDLAESVSLVDNFGMDVGFAEMFHSFLMNMEQKYGIDYNYLNSIMMKLEQRPLA